MGLADELSRIADAAGAFAVGDERLAGVVPVENHGGRVYLCAYEASERRTWLALDDGGRPLESRSDVREAVSLAAMCELAEETAAGGDLDELRSQLVALRITENPPGIDDAEAAVSSLQAVLAVHPRLASAAYLDEIGAATRRLERALDGSAAGSPFGEAMRSAVAAVESLTAEVEANYKGPLG